MHAPHVRVEHRHARMPKATQHPPHTRRTEVLAGAIVDHHRVLGTEAPQVTIGSDAGTVVGELGETATLIDRGLYFEIRHRSDSLDPMLWLNTRQLQPPGHNPG